MAETPDSNLDEDQEVNMNNEYAEQIDATMHNFHTLGSWDAWSSYNYYWLI